MLSDDLLELARELVPSGPSRPKEVNLRRALSCTYYAMFHAAARTCADTLVGTATADRTDRAWRQVYRSIEHGGASKRCDQIVRGNTELGFPPEIVTFARQFPVAMQERHDADYDPSFKPLKGDVLASILAADQAVSGVGEAKLRDRRAFAAFLLFRTRS